MWKKHVSRIATYPSHFIPSRLGMKCDVARNSKGKGGGGEKGPYFLGKTSVPFLKKVYSGLGARLLCTLIRTC